MPRRLDPLAALLAAALASLTLTAPAAAVEPADDHSGGATVLGRGLSSQGPPVAGAIERPGDRDWYSQDLNPIPHGYDGTGIVVVTRTGGTCAADALHATVFNLEGHAMLWTVVAPGKPTWLNFTDHRAGRYLIEIDAAGAEGCGDVTYTVSFPTSVVMGVIFSRASRRCVAEQGALVEAKRQLHSDQKGVKSKDPRKRKSSSGYLKGDQKKVNTAKAKLAKCRKPR